MIKIDNDWKELLKENFKGDHYMKLKAKLDEECSTYKVYPRKEDIFNALALTSYDDTKVVILGQDPYHGEGQAHGLSFSVKPGVKIPPSLKNIFKELNHDLGYIIPEHGYLAKWAEEGVLLLNTILTVREGQPNSHKKIGWEVFTDSIITLLNNREKPVVFILWGKNAHDKEALITSNHHYIIKSPHPSPLSANRGFFGSRPFSKVNEILRSLGVGEINWRIE
ncbi:uracil-DNA glycosylase [Alkaliphilus transvaalensis]|uniref:uracil-DNA glycosylase n=1 Tax=Alkaliphilus transvaalensis TaxID=114628 RepID=UPI000A4089BE|nr:uracil-DNA glycosylase [Alkaliphilus transvaalensis]